jgi:hypothetical protein
MFPNLPSLHGFQPRFYTGSASRFYLPMQYDLVAITQPKVIALLGFGDGQAFFTFFQAARENEIACRCVAIRRSSATENADDDEAWQKGKADGEEFYGEMAEFIAGSSAELVATFPDGSVDLLLIDDCDSYDIASSEFEAWHPKLSSDAVVLVHGIYLERENGVRRFWQEISHAHPAAKFHDGIGLGIMLRAGTAPESQLFSRLFGSSDQQRELMEIYRLIADRIDSRAHQNNLERENAALRTRQIVFDTMQEELRRAQDTIDHHARVSAHLQLEQEALHGEDPEAEQVVDAEAKKIERLVVPSENLECERQDAPAQIKQNATHQNNLSLAEKFVRQIRRLLPRK